MPTTWTKVTKASGTSWTKIAKPILSIAQTGGSPIGLLLSLTYSTTVNATWTKVSKAANTTWTKITKAT